MARAGKLASRPYFVVPGLDPEAVEMVCEQEVAPPNSRLGRSVFHQKASGWWGREGALSGDFAVGQGRGQG